ncbi:MAG TPA: tetratricopeptide repeat protein, partial [Anaeromyxobacteraceae bacterium]|nr:tetratricopeptide repeat protein [Anaeromyxobacteraceae bacterium]
MSPFSHLVLLAAALAASGPSAERPVRAEPVEPRTDRSTARVRADPDAIREAQREQAAEPPPASPRAIAHYLEARRLLAEGEPDRAARALRQAVVHDGASAELRLALAEALAVAGDTSGAMAEANRAIALARGEPLAVDAYVLVGRLHAAAGELEPAILAVRRAVRLAGANADARREPPAPEPWQVLAELYAGTGDEPAAARTLEDLTARLPDAGGGYRELGRALLDQGAVDAAEKHLRRAVEVDAGDLEALRLLAEVHERQRRLDAAREDLLGLLALEPDDASALLSLGRLALRDDDAAAAQRWFERHVTAARDRIEARARVAFEWLDVERPADALAAVRDGGGDDARLRFAEGLALEGLRRWDEAARALGAVGPSAGELYFSARASLAYALSRAGRHAAAERALTPALEARPG